MELRGLKVEVEALKEEEEEEVGWELSRPMFFTEGEWARASMPPSILCSAMASCTLPATARSWQVAFFRASTAGSANPRASALCASRERAPEQ